ncbi:DUF664 domain-containing protein [Streptomyces puniciscabiei]|uniref:mycothiol transferase n=1 Tax=Streptomyces puniciscabiei TaxID=164348 RepID=UPI0037A3EC84
MLRRVVEDADVGEAFGVRPEECPRARAIASCFDSPDDTVDFRGETISLRYVLTHVIEEYARHNGHAAHYAKPSTEPSASCGPSCHPAGCRARGG